jgi:hypothetical protein
LVLLLIRVMKSSIPVQLLDMGNGPELFEQASQPFLCCFLGSEVVTAAVLKHFPIFDWKSKQEVVPPHQILGKDSSMDFWS